MSNLPTIDHPVVDVNIPRFNQGVVAFLAVAAFVFQSPWLVGGAFALLLISRVAPRLAPVTQLYVRVLRPRLHEGGPTEYEDARPPAFSQWIGVGVTGAALGSFALGLDPVGWALTLLVGALAALAAAARICVGCLLYERYLA